MNAKIKKLEKDLEEVNAVKSRIEQELLMENLKYKYEDKYFVVEGLEGLSNYYHCTSVENSLGGRFDIIGYNSSNSRHCLDSIGIGMFQYFEVACKREISKQEFESVKISVLHYLSPLFSQTEIDAAVPNIYGILKNGISIISEERNRQIKKEGWTAEHDDLHIDQSLAIAAACYCITADIRNYNDNNIPECWPWESKWWKPSKSKNIEEPDYIKGRIHELAKAGALIAAEIDRLSRLDVSEELKRLWEIKKKDL